MPLAALARDCHKAGMATGHLSIDLGALQRNWRQLDAMSGGHVDTGACVKADGYGLGAGHVARALAQAGCRTFYVAVAEEGAALRKTLGPDPDIRVFGGHMEGDAELLRGAALTPMLNSVEQLTRHFEALPGHAFGIQLDTGMNRLGMEPAEWAAVREIALSAGPKLVMSHLACADEPDHVMNRDQLSVFHDLVAETDVPVSLAATGGILLGPDFHFNATRPGIGIYGGLPFDPADPVVTARLPVIQIRDLAEGETVGYGNTWTAPRASRVATVAAGYADGLHRALGAGLDLYAGDVPCPLVGRVSMDLITVDVTDLDDVPDTLDILNAHQTIEDLARVIGTIGYEVLTSLGARYRRSYSGA